MVARREPKMTLPTQLVLGVLLAEPDKEHYGLEVCQAAGLPSGTVHPILARLESCGWVTSQWEEVDPREQGRPRRRYYRMAPDGVAAAQAAVARAHGSITRLGLLRAHPAGGT
ncbi:PadR family transcriptional regulator [Saccharothrix coeruleofusca]|uniref:PadR family transcriptional regulator n=1 Tax=Saccharothrix coeruleofusca TaxID=33919 RepID=UPI001FD02F31|nr:helix-turn-helix transcriptional regulator [Saccharothrix coeruleofusca]